MQIHSSQHYSFICSTLQYDFDRFLTLFSNKSTRLPIPNINTPNLGSVRQANQSLGLVLIALSSATCLAQLSQRQELSSHQAVLI